MERHSWQWGHYAALVILSAMAAAHRPHYLIYVGLLRLAWCTLGGHFGRGVGAVLVFLIAYLSVVLPGFLSEEEHQAAPAAQVAPAVQPARGLDRPVPAGAVR